MVSRRCEFTDWLLQRCSCWCTKDSNGQVTACAERRCARRHRHSEVWLRPGSDTTWRTSLARRPQPGILQADSDSSSVSERPRTTVPVGLLRPGRQCWHSAASAFRQTSTTCILAVPRYRLNTYGRRAFSVAGPTVWNSLPDFIGTRPSVEIVSGVCLKRICSLDTSAFSALEVPDDNCAL